MAVFLNPFPTLDALQVWSVVRGKGKRIPSGGTLVVGREQDCEGGCFDSDPGKPVLPLEKNRVLVVETGVSRQPVCGGGQLQD